MYCYYIPSMLGFVYAFYIVIRYAGGTEEMTLIEALISIAIAVIAAAATIIAAIIGNKKSIQEIQGCVDTTKEVLIRTNDEKSNRLFSDHDRIIDDTRKISDYVSRQDAYAQVAAKQKVDLDQLFSQITALAKKIDDSDSERKHILEERDRAIFEKQKMEETLIGIRQQNAELQSELRQTRAELRQANQIIAQIQNGRNIIGCDEQSFDPEL